MSSVKNWRTDFQNFLRGRGKIQQWAELGAVNHLQQLAAENRRNSEAEAAHTRRVVWGEEQGKNVAETDDMGTTILGDINQPPAVVYPPQQQQANPLATLLLGALMAGGGGLAGYMLAKPQQQATAPAADKGYDDETVTIGLGRIEDLK